MSFGTFWGTDPTDVATYQKILGKYLEGGAAAVPPLNSVLGVGNSAANQSATDFNTLGCIEIETGKVYQGNNLDLEIGEVGDTLKILGAITKGSILVGNGVETKELPVGANGLVLKANSGAAYGVEWGTDASGGTVMAVNAGTNISVSGTIAQPIVNFATPTTSNIVLGVGTEIEATNGATTMTLDATGLNDTYSSGGVVNQEDIEVNATSVVQLLSATDGGSYLNTDTTNVSNTGIVENLSATNLSTNNIGNVSLTCFSNSAGIACGCSAPTTPPYPEVSATAGLSATTTNAQLTISQSAPFAISYSTTLDINGITQNNTGGVAGFTINTNTQPLALTTGDHITFSADNIDLDATGRLVLPSLASGDYLDYNAGSLKIVNDSVGGSANPLLVLQNNNNTAGATTFETYKNDQPTSTGGDNIASWSATCNTNVGKTEISRVNHIAYGTGASNNDGGISLACKVNSSITNFLICNGGANNAIGSGEVQVFKPITSTSPNNLNLICPTAGGTAKIQSVSNIELEATGDNLTTISGANTTISTTGVGSQIEFKPETTAGKIVFTGASLQSNTSSGNSGEHLVIYLNGVKYHIALQTP
ncbi:putative collagen triple helix repeat-containing protein [Dishui Lake virophage 4]|nr:putative collagen triple helix repeat-containing protein [Dishui Lake virophage 4]